MVTRGLTWRSHDGPTPAIVAAWLTRAGQHGQQVQQHVVQPGQVDRPQVQADERWVQLVGRRVWRAMAMAVPSRRWLGGALSAHRDWQLLTTRVARVRTCAHTLAIVVCGEGVASSVTACLRVFRPAGHTGRRGWSWRRGCGWGTWASGLCSGGGRAIAPQRRG